MKTAAKVDANQKEIVEYARGKGFSVLIISQLKNCCDIMISKGGHTIACEIKDPNKPPSKRRLTEGEQKFIGS
jgi:Holliday junction resolvase